MKFDKKVEFILRCIKALLSAYTSCCIALVPVVMVLNTDVFNFVLNMNQCVTSVY
jgi:hypothetical protein